MNYKYSLLILHFIILVIFLIEFIIVWNIKASELIIEFLQYELLFLYLYTIFTAKYILKLKWVSLYILFFISLGTFVYSRIFLDILGLFDFGTADRFFHTILPNSVKQETLIYLLFSLLFIHLGAIIGNLKKTSYSDNTCHNIFFDKFGSVLFFISLPGILTKSYIDLKYILENGYLAVYTGEINSIQYPFWTTGSGTLMMLGLAFLFASILSKKKFFIIAIFVIILKTMALFKGVRGEFLVSLLFLVWYYYQFITTKDIKVLLTVTIGFLAIVLMQFMLFFRLNMEFAFISFSDVLVNFFAANGTTILVLEHMIDSKDEFINNRLPYIIEPLISFSSYGGNSLNKLEHSNFLADHLTYFLSPNRYLNGEGIGGSFLGELYDLGFLGFILGSVLLGYMIMYLEKLFKSSQLMLLLSFPIVYAIIWMPRGSFFPSIQSLYLIVIFYFIYKYLNINFSRNA